MTFDYETFFFSAEMNSGRDYQTIHVYLYKMI